MVLYRLADLGIVAGASTSISITEFEIMISEKDMDIASEKLAQGVLGDMPDFAPGLSVDGLSSSILAQRLRWLQLA